MLRFLTAGESHGPCLMAILEGMPPGIRVSTEELQAELCRRRRCYGRGGRADIERDDVSISSGISDGRTTGAPLSVTIPNKDHANWKTHVPISWPRPGHADLAGAAKYGLEDCRPVAERSSARETAARVACGYFAKKLLAEIGCKIVSYVISIGDVEAVLPDKEARMQDAELALRLASLAETSPVRCPHPPSAKAMMEAVDAARSRGDSLGGVIETAAVDVPAGLGCYTHWDKRLDTRIAGALMSLGGVKGVEIGGGFDLARRAGSQTQDPIYPAPQVSPVPEASLSAEASPTSRVLPDPRRFIRPSNRAGGIEGGVSNGQLIFARVAQKPIPTLRMPLPSVDLTTGEAVKGHIERSDTCAVGSLAVVTEAVIALVIADALLERYGQDTWPPKGDAPCAGR